MSADDDIYAARLELEDWLRSVITAIDEMDERHCHTPTACGAASLCLGGCIQRR
jgi:hypothetical protein